MASDKTKKKFTFPSAFTILFLLLIVVASRNQEWFIKIMHQSTELPEKGDKYGEG